MPFSLLTFAGLLVMAIATFAVTELLSRRHTVWRRYFVLHDFARSNGLRLRIGKHAPEGLPAVVAVVPPAPRARWHFYSRELSLLRLHIGAETFNLLLLETGGPWPATALRPSVATRSLFDLLELFSYPSPYGSHRFTLHGTNPAAARRLSDSPCRALLPADLGLLVDGNLLLIDFSTRPFDTIEFGRMIGLARQLAAALPAITTEGADSAA